MTTLVEALSEYPRRQIGGYLKLLKDIYDTIHSLLNKRGAMKSRILDLKVQREQLTYEINYLESQLKVIDKLENINGEHEREFCD